MGGPGSPRRGQMTFWPEPTIRSGARQGEGLVTFPYPCKVPPPQLWRGTSRTRRTRPAEGVDRGRGRLGPVPRDGPWAPGAGGRAAAQKDPRWDERGGGLAGPQAVQGELVNEPAEWTHTRAASWGAGSSSGSRRVLGSAGGRLRTGAAAVVPVHVQRQETAVRVEAPGRGEWTRLCALQVSRLDEAHGARGHLPCSAHQSVQMPGSPRDAQRHVPPNPRAPVDQPPGRRK